MPRFRKKPIEIDAIQLCPAQGEHGTQIINWIDIEEEFGDQVIAIGNNIEGIFECLCFQIKTPEGTMTALPEDWIIRDIKGDVYPCKPEIFAATYDPVSCNIVQEPREPAVITEIKAKRKRELEDDILARADAIRQRRTYAQ